MRGRRGGANGGRGRRSNRRTPADGEDEVEARTDVDRPAIAMLVAVREASVTR